MKKPLHKKLDVEKKLVEGFVSNRNYWKCFDLEVNRPKLKTLKEIKHMEKRKKCDILKTIFFSDNLSSIEEWIIIKKLTMGEDGQRVIIMLNNLIKYSEQEAREGSYLNAILILDQSIQDINRKIEGNNISNKEAEAILNRIQTIKQTYIEKSKMASPKKFNYDGPSTLEAQF